MRNIFKAHRGSLTSGFFRYTGAMETYPVDVAGLHRELPIVSVGNGVSIALLNLLGDTRLTEAAAGVFAEHMPADVQVMVTPEVKAVPLAHAISVRTGLPYVVVRKTVKPYMISPVSREVISITTGKPQLLVLDGSDIASIRERKVAIVDDVVSTGSTLKGLRELIEQVGGELSVVMAVFTEGNGHEGVVSLGHLPLFT